jgi:PE-PGRS family protein with aspartyl peptidase-like domain
MPTLRPLCAAVIVGAMLMSAGCGSHPSPTAGSSVPSASPRSSAGAGSAPGSIPMRVARTRMGFSCVIVDVSAGGGPSVPVLVDTGSSGLLLPASAVGPGVEPTGREFQTGFVGTPRFTATIIRATLTIGGSAGLTTANPIAIGSVAGPGSVFPTCGGAQGVLGVGVGSPGPAAPALNSPLPQLPPPWSDGYTISLTGQAATLRVGKPIPTPTSVSLPLRTENGTYPDGRQAYQRDVVLCWTVGSAHACGLTNIDSGFSVPAIRPDFLPTAPRQGSLVSAGTPVAIAAPNGPVLESFTAASTPPEARIKLANLFGETEANTGIGFFMTHSVGFDVSTGHVVITPNNGR